MVNFQEIINEFKITIKELYGDRLDKIILYGSYARGDFNEDSDIDFLVVLKDKKIDLLQELNMMISRVNELSIKNSIYISSKPTTVHKIETSGSPFYYRVRKEGKVIA